MQVLGTQEWGLRPYDLQMRISILLRLRWKIPRLRMHQSHCCTPSRRTRTPKSRWRGQKSCWIIKNCSRSRRKGWSRKESPSRLSCPIKNDTKTRTRQESNLVRGTPNTRWLIKELPHPNNKIGTSALNFRQTAHSWSSPSELTCSVKQPRRCQH